MSRAFVGMVPFLVACACSSGETEDPCEQTKASMISVQVRVALHGQDPLDPPTVSSDKVPCGAPVKGAFDLPGAVEADGEFLSHWAGYDLHNTKDVVRIHYDAAGVGTGMRILTYEMLAPHAGGTYVVDLGGGS